MKKNILVFVIVLITTNLLFGNELSNYTIDEINCTQSGKEEGRIGWQPRIAGGYSGPMTFTIYADKIYVPDLVNNRINVYTNDFRYLKTINEIGDKLVNYATKLIVNDQEQIIANVISYGLKKINKKGEELFSINYKNLPNIVYYNNNFFLFKKYLFIYNDDYKIQYIAPDGKIENTEKALEILSKLSTKTNNLNKQSAKGGGIKSMKIDTKNIVINDCFYSTEFHKHEAFYKKVKAGESNKKTDSPASGGGAKLKITLDDYDKHFIGYDNDHNSYWKGLRKISSDYKTYSVIIISKFGDVLDGFTYGEYRKSNGQNKINADYSKYPTTGAKIAIAPSGDVYFLQGSKEKYTLYKVKRQW